MNGILLQSKMTHDNDGMKWMIKQHQKNDATLFLAELLYIELRIKLPFAPCQQQVAEDQVYPLLLAR